MRKWSSQNLQQFSLSGFNFTYNSLENILLHFPNLVDLEINKNCKGYSSDVIFTIIKHLRKLKNFIFVFPNGSPLNEETLNLNKDLQLPEIERIEFSFNDGINNQHLRKLLKFFKNASSFYVNADWPKFNKTSLQIIIRELTRLKLFELSRYSDREVLHKISEADWKKIKDNIQKFNQNPHLIKVLDQQI